MNRSTGTWLAALVAAFSCGASVDAAQLNATAITSGGGYNCALTIAGGVKCWGLNGAGALGDGTTTNRPSPVDVVGLTSGVAAISANGGVTCALTTAGGVKCWGLGGVGDGTTSNRLTPVDVAGLSSGVVAISVGESHTCAITSAGGVKCWGWNDRGQVGDGTTIDRLTPVDAAGLNSGVVAISAGDRHTCAITSGGAVKCWGANEYGQLGDGTATDRLTPVDVAGLTSGTVAVSAGLRYTCAVTSTGGVKCWGENGGKLGDGTIIERRTPVDVLGLSGGVASISTGDHSCAVTTSGGAKCWGTNFTGQLGTGTYGDGTAAPVDVLGLTSGVMAIDASVFTSCALTTSGGVKCWGDAWNWNPFVLGGVRGAPGAPVTVTVPGVAQSVAFSALPDRGINDPPFQVTVTASSGLPLSFASVTPDVCGLSGATVTIVAMGICTLSANQPGDAVYDSVQSTRSFVVAAQGTLAIPRLSGISTRTQVLTGNDVSIAGFIIGGSASKTVVINARGPSLASQGVAGALVNPTLWLVPGSGPVRGNDNWLATPNASTIQSLELAPPNALESSIMATLAPGAYTAILSGVDSGTGVGIVEVMEVDHPEVPLIGISTRAQVLTGDDVVIGGFAIEGSAPLKVVVRARGPSLGIGNVLANPTLQLFSGSTLIASNDDWGSAPNALELSASGFAPANVVESAILVTLNPGSYTAVVAGVGGGTGVGIVEVYVVP